MGRQTYRQGAQADREAGTFWDSEWVSRWRARLLLAGSAELCDWIRAPSLPFSTERICGHTVCSYWGIRHNERRRFRRFTLIADGCVCASCLKVLVGSLFRNEVCFPGQTSTWRQRKPERRRADRPEAADRRWPVKHKWHTGSTLTAYSLLAELSRKYGTIKSQFMIHS